MQFRCSRWVGCGLALAVVFPLLQWWLPPLVPLWGSSSSLGTPRSSGKPFKSLANFNTTSIDEGRPPLSSLIDDYQNITGDVQFLLDFAIIGHPKTATTTILYWLRSHPEILMPRHEVRSLRKGKPAALVEELYTSLPAGSLYKRGYKSPIDLETPKALDLIRQYWPQTVLIVGLRHPVKWFESFYNFHLRHGDSMPPPSSLIGGCSKETYMVCTDRSLFHIHLSFLGKTKLSDAAEQELLTHPRKERPFGMKVLPNKVFLYEINQLNDANPMRAQQYRADLSEFLGLEDEALQPRTNHTDSVTPAEVALDICQKQYGPLRDELMKNSIAASKWIRNYFLQSPDVTVSSPDYFKELLLSWLIDPCDNK